MSSQELTVVRSSGLSSASRSASSGRVGCPRPEATLTVECTTGIPKVLTVLTVDAAFCGVMRWSASGSRTGALVMGASPSRSEADAADGSGRHGEQLSPDPGDLPSG